MFPGGLSLQQREELCRDAGEVDRCDIDLIVTAVCPKDSGLHSEKTAGILGTNLAHAITQGRRFAPASGESLGPPSAQSLVERLESLATATEKGTGATDAGKKVIVTIPDEKGQKQQAEYDSVKVNITNKNFDYVETYKNGKSKTEQSPKN